MAFLRDNLVKKNEPLFLIAKVRVSVPISSQNSQNEKSELENKHQNLLNEHQKLKDQFQNIKDKNSKHKLTESDDLPI